MPNANAAATVYRCKVCGAELVGFGAFGSHMQAHRAAEREARGEPAAPVSRRAGVSKPPNPASRPRVRVRPARHIEDIGLSRSGTPLPAERDALDVPPSRSDDAGASDPTGAAPARPSVSQPTIRISPEQRAASVNESIRDALPLAMLADLLRSLSVAISEADGAGPAGYLSEIQATQVASLLYDATIDLVVQRFNGNVTRFKAGMAVVIIVIAKGRVHGAAIRDRLAERRQAAMSAQIAAEQAFNEEPRDDYQNGQGSSGQNDAIEAAMRLQRSQPAVRLD